MIEQIEDSSNQSTAYVHKLEKEVQQLQLQLEQKNLQLEHNTISPTRASRPSSIERTNQQRERSSSIRRSNNPAVAENDLRQRTTSTDIGFKKDFLPE